MAQENHGPKVPYDADTAPSPDGSSLSGRQLVLLMGATLIAAILVLNFVSG